MRVRIPEIPWPGPIPVLAVVESVTFGLVARHAFEEGTRAAVPLALTFLVLGPVVVGYRTASDPDGPRLGVLTPSSVLLMLLIAGLAQGPPAILVMAVLMPFFLLLALFGGMVAHTVEAAIRVLRWMTARRSRAPAPGRSTLTPPAREAADAREEWRQVIIRTPS